MESKKAEKWIANYIKEQNILIKQMSLDLNIPEEKLKGESKEGFDIEEFLEICNYLNIAPGKLQEEIGYSDVKL